MSFLTIFLPLFLFYWLIQPLVLAKQMDHDPNYVATAQIVSDTIAVDRDKISELLANEEIKLLRAKHEAELKDRQDRSKKDAQEIARYNNEQIELAKKDAARRAEREDAEWVLRYPDAARERDNMRRREKDLERVAREREHALAIEEKDAAARRELLLADKHSTDRKETLKLVGVVVGGVACGILTYASYL